MLASGLYKAGKRIVGSEGAEGRISGSAGRQHGADETLTSCSQSVPTRRLVRAPGPITHDGRFIQSTLEGFGEDRERVTEYTSGISGLSLSLSWRFLLLSFRSSDQ